jgi:pectate lyase
MNVTTTTGGSNATPQTVTTVAALSAAAAGTGAAVIYVSGVLPNGVIEVGSNKTIVGLCGAEIHGHIDLSGSSNVIIRNLTIVGYAVGDCALDPTYDSTVGCSSGYDAVTVINGAHHIWIDHCDISDGTDGNLDITNGANLITVSWTKFHYSARTDNSGSDSTGASGHRFSSLIGGTDSPSSFNDAAALNVTWHHNWWADRVVERQPRVRFGHNHLFNNLWSSSGNNYCVRAGKQAHLLLENNVFTGVKNPHEFNSSSDQSTANITARGNVYNSTSGTRATGGGGTAFSSAGYKFTLDAASGVQSAVQSGAGPH